MMILYERKSCNYAEVGTHLNSYLLIGFVGVLFIMNGKLRDYHSTQA